MQIMTNFYTSFCTWPLSHVRNSRKCSLKKVSLFYQIRDKWILQGNNQKSSMAQTLIMQICMNTLLLIKQTSKQTKMPIFYPTKKIQAQFKYLQLAQNMGSLKNMQTSTMALVVF